VIEINCQSVFTAGTVNGTLHLVHADRRQKGRVKPRLW